VIYAPIPDYAPVAFFVIFVGGLFVSYWVAQTTAWARLQRYISRILRYDP
jgi:hypothetical protein